jgi:hypothetical protein
MKNRTDTVINTHTPVSESMATFSDFRQIMRALMSATLRCRAPS